MYSGRYCSPQKCPPPPPPPDFSGLIRAFYVALHAPGGATWQPHSPEPATLEVRLTERDYELADGDPHRLVVQRYNYSSQVWEEAPTSLDLPWLRIHTTTDALGLFATTIRLEEDTGGPVAALTEVRPASLPASSDSVEPAPRAAAAQFPCFRPHQHLAERCPAYSRSDVNPESDTASSPGPGPDANPGSDAGTCQGGHPASDFGIAPKGNAGPCLSSNSNAYTYPCAYADSNANANRNPHPDGHSRSRAYPVHQWPASPVWR